MNYIDIIIGIIILVGAVQGFRKGLIIELGSIVALLLGLWGSIRFSYVLGNYLSTIFNYRPLPLKIASFLITFIGIVIVIHLLANLVDKLINAVALGFINQLAGFLFGLLKTALICSILLILLDQVDRHSQIIPQKDKKQSRVYEPIRTLIPSLLPFLHLGDQDERNPFEEKTPPSHQV